MRINSVDDLEGLQMSEGVKKQLEAALADGPVTRLPARDAGSEEDVGRKLVAWVDKLEFVHPTLGPVIVGDYFYHVPNGLARTRAEGGAFKAQGLRSGWPDYGLDLPLDRYHGMRLEIKREDGAKPTESQLTYLVRLERAGYFCLAAWGVEDAQRAIRRYLDLAR